MIIKRERLQKIQRVYDNQLKIILCNNSRKGFTRTISLYFSPQEYIAKKPGLKP